MSFSVSNVVKFPQPTLQFNPDEISHVDHTKETPVLGGILSDSNYCWHAKGPCLEVRNIKTGRNVGAWTFGCILKDSSTRVVCVEEIQKSHGQLSILLVGIECTISGGMICIFEVFGSKVIRAIQVKSKITSLHVVDSGLDNLNLPGPLRNFDGIIAVGTEGGDVYLVDVCRQICEEALQKIDTTVVRDELCPSQIILLTPKDISNIDYYKEASIRNGDHLAIHINVVLDSRTEHFTLKGPKNDDRLHVNKAEVAVSAVHYCPQLTSLLVGYNFGAYQLWNLSNLSLVYTSPVCDEHIPITHFSVQEPADDPKAFCYVWVAYSPSGPYQKILPLVVMYSFCYDSKEYHEGYGYLYQNFQYGSVRFQMELGLPEDHKVNGEVGGGSCMGLQQVSKALAHKEMSPDDLSGDGLTLCLISWTVWLNHNETQSFLLVFDLNQWYKEQMPNVPNWSDCSSYMLRVGLSDLLNMSGHKGGQIFNAKLNKKTLRQFVGTQKLEEHFFPTSLSFDLVCLRENDVATIHEESLQRSLLSQIESAGPLCLLRPGDFYQQVVSLGLMPLFTEASQGITYLSTEQQREVLLNVGLEQRLVGWLCRCASEWANGSFSSAGCSLEFLVNWAFQRAVVLKNNCDRLCTPLFDYSESRLDSNTNTLLNNCTRQLNNVNSFYSYVRAKLEFFLANVDAVVEQHKCMQTVSVYFEVLQWLVNVGLLPECHPSAYPRPDETERISAPYPVQQLTEYYSEKRAVLQQLSQDTFASSDSLLFIDNLISNKCGAEALQKQWQDDGGTGLYPPPSLQSLLRTYLMEGADISHKHSLIIYVFLDLAMALDQNRYALVITHLIKFPAVFKVSPSIIKITQAFWQLDHGDYTTAMEQLLDPFVLSDDLEHWHHSVALRALLLQNQHKYALLYMQVRKPPISDEKDILTAISLFIANNMLDEAFYFQKQYQSGNDEKLLMHLFNECNKSESIKGLLYRSLDTNEERVFFKYLQTLQDPTADDLQVFYYLLRSRFVEAFETHDKSKRKKPECQGLIGQRSATRADQVVKIFKSHLPEVSQNLVNTVRRERANLWKEVSRPTPLSVFVHNNKEHVQYKSTVIHAVLAKTKQTFTENTTMFNELNTEDIPFLRTPKAITGRARIATPIITPKIIEMPEAADEGPSPCKRLKLTPRVSISSSTSALSRSGAIHTQMSTPIIKRRTPRKFSMNLSVDKTNVCTPQSILKVRNLVRKSDVASVTDDSLLLDDLGDNDSLNLAEKSPRKGFGLKPRRSLSRTTDRRSYVRFIDSRLSSSFSDNSITQKVQDTSPSGKETLSKSPQTSTESSLLRQNVSSKDSSLSDAAFYSPDASMNESSKSQDVNKMDSQAVDQVFEDEAPPSASYVEIEPKTADEVANLRTDTTDGLLAAENKSDDLSPALTQSPRARRSYKRSLGEASPVRSSPRLSKISSPQVEKQSPNISTSVSSPQLGEKIRGRKPLGRQLLENITLAKIVSSPSLDRTSPSKLISKETTFTKTETTTITKRSLNETEETTTESKVEKLDSISSDPESPQKSFRHLESSSSKKRMFKMIDSDADTSAYLSSLECSPYTGPELPEYVKQYIQQKRDSESQSNVSKNLFDTKKNSIVTDEVKENSDEGDDDAVGIDIYEDLSSGAEDVEQVIAQEQAEQVMIREQDEELEEVEVNFARPVDDEAIKVYEDLSNSSSQVYNEEHVFDVAVDVNTDDIPIETHSDHSNMSIGDDMLEPSDLRASFLAEQDATDDEVIEIDSSSNDVAANTDENSNDGNIHISFERNIYNEEMSSCNHSEQTSDSHNSIVSSAAGNILEDHAAYEMETDRNSNSTDNEVEVSSESGDGIASSALNVNEPIVEEPDEEDEDVEGNVNEFSEVLIEELSDNIVLIEETEDFLAAQVIEKDLDEEVIEKDVEEDVIIDDVMEEIILEVESRDGERNAKEESERIMQDDVEKVPSVVEVTVKEKSVDDALILDDNSGDFKKKVTVLVDVEATTSKNKAGNVSLPRRVTRRSSMLQTTAEEPDNSKENDEVSGDSESKIKTATPAKRITRRSSRLSVSNELGAVQSSSDEHLKQTVTVTVEEVAGSTMETDQSTAARRTRRSFSVDQIKLQESSLSENPNATLNESNLLENAFDDSVFLVTPTLRITRSASVDQLKTFGGKRPLRSTRGKSVDDSIEMTAGLFDDDVFPSTPAIRKTRSTSVDQFKTYGRKKTLRSAGENSQDDDELKNVFDTSTSVITPVIRRTRSGNIGPTKTYVRKSVDAKRESSEEITEQMEKPKGKGKTIKGQLPAIVEDASETYSTSRRLTRHQASMLKDVDVLQKSSSDLQRSGLGQELQVNIIDIMDNPEALYGTSPSSSSIGSSQKPARRLSRSSSVASDSPASSEVKVSTPTRRTRQSAGLADSSIPTGVKTRLRTRSTDTESLPSPPKRPTRKSVSKTDAENDSPEQTTSRTRVRTNSSSSTKSDGTDSSRRSIRGKKGAGMSSKTDLMEITEEQSSETTEAKPKRTRSAKK